MFQKSSLLAREAKALKVLFLFCSAIVFFFLNVCSDFFKLWWNTVFFVVLNKIRFFKWIHLSNIHNIPILYTYFFFFLQLFLQNFAMHFSIIYSNSKNIDPKFESSFANKLSLQSRFWACNARFFSNETIFCDFFQSLAKFPDL